jgi:putative FmdB family regulatory protein
MPIYEYRCEQCGEFEVMQKITGRPLAKCPTCRSKVTKLISNTSFQLKGTGWYATDYAHKGNGGETATQSKSETKTESKASSDSSSTKDSKPNPTAAAA